MITALALPDPTSFGAFMLGTLLRVTLLLVVVRLALPLLRRRSASVRHMVVTSALFAVLLLPLSGVLVPASVRLPVLPDWIASSRAVFPAAEASRGTPRADPPTGAPESAVRATPRPPSDVGARAGESGMDGAGWAGTEGQWGPSGTEAPPIGEGAGIDRDAGAAAWSGPAAGSDGTGAWRIEESRMRLVAALWLAGMLTVLFRLGLGFRKVDSLRRGARPALDPRILGAAETAARRVGIPTPDVRLCRSIRVPLSIGPLSAAVLLPSDAPGWPVRRLHSVLLHEFAHLRRRDLLFQLMARAACGIYWFHPLVWHFARRQRQESERACDDLVLGAGTLASGYASELLAMARNATHAPAPAVSLSMADRSDFEGRLLAILEPTQRRAQLRRRTVLAGLAASAACVVVFASVSLGSASIPDDPAAVTAGEATDGAPPAAIDAEAGDGPARALLELLHDSSAEVRGAAVRSLGGRLEEAAVPPLVEALRDRSRSVRKDAVDALGRIEDPAALPALEERLLHDRSQKVRMAAAEAIGETETGEAVRILADALDRLDDRRVRERVVLALGETGRAEAVAVLAPLLDGDAVLGHPALRALAELGSPEALALVIVATRSDDAQLRVRAAQALGSWGR